jgi:hypothetical protein
LEQVEAAMKKSLGNWKFLEKFADWVTNLLPTITPTGTVKGNYRLVAVLRFLSFHS